MASNIWPAAYLSPASFNAGSLYLFTVLLLKITSTILVIDFFCLFLQRFLSDFYYLSDFDNFVDFYEFKQ